MYINEKLEEFKKFVKGKKVAVMGMGVSNTPLIRYLMNLDAEITVFDKKNEDELDKFLIEEYAIQGVNFSLGEKYLDSLVGYDIIFRSPSMRPDKEELLAEINRGAMLTSEIEMLVELCPCKVIGITGSDGKTTTTTLIYKILCEAGYNCYLGGNIGIPLFSKIDEMKPEDIVVLELSSFQLMTLKKSTDVAIVTNISPNHLDIHKSYDEYIDAKKNIFKYQDKNGLLIINYDNEITKSFNLETSGKVRYFSTREKLNDGVYLDNDVICFSNNGNIENVFDTNNILLLGKHNIENACTAIAAVKDFASNDAIFKVLSTFKGVEHRNEFVRNINGVKWYNDSIGSSPTRTIAGLTSFKSKVILIAGGYDKHLDYTDMGKYVVEHVKCLILLGQTKDKIKKATLEAMKDTVSNVELPIIECSNLEEAVNNAYKVAKDGDIVFFSPASASFDMFKNFEERGNKFKQSVMEL